MNILMSNIKSAKKGDIIFREGDRISSLILIQSGGANLCLLRNKKNIELLAVGAGHVLGTQSFSGQQVHDHSCVAVHETKYMEIPTDLAKAQIESAPQFVKILIKSLNDRFKVTVGELKSLKMEKDPAPLADDQVAKAFGSVFHSANHKGKRNQKEKNLVYVEWITLKQYAQRVFGESPRRLEQSIHLLVKLKLASLDMGKPPDNPDGPDELIGVKFYDLSAIEAFFEFYQYHYFKNGRTELLKVDDLMMNLVGEFAKLGESLEKDRFGVVSGEMPKVIEAFRNDVGINLNTGHFTQLEAKGVFLKRTARADGAVVVQWDQKELEQIFKSWRILKEIDKWNEKGFVDLNEEEKQKKKSGAPSCSHCGLDIPTQAKFCPECGTKVEIAQAS
jgi:hypothetical protein